MKADFLNFSPPGLNLKTERQFFITGMVCATLYSFGFWGRYFHARGNLYGYDGNVRVLLPEAVMPDFSLLLDHAFAGFAVLALCMLGFVVYHYAYHHQGSKSIYLMRRLPNRWERHKRCWTLPVLAALCCLLLAVVLLLLYYMIYQIATPQECLTPHQWQKLWSVIL